MLVEYLLLVISLFLIVRELFPETDRFHPKLKKIVYISIVGFLFILSIINIYNKNQENEALIQTAKNILGGIEDVTTDLNENLTIVKESGEEIKKIDSVLEEVEVNLSGQVTLLNDATKKSKELFELEKQRYYDKRPLIKSSSADIKIKFSDKTNEHSIAYPIYNTGARPASNILIQDAIICGNKLWSKVSYQYVDEGKAQLNRIYPGTENLQNLEHPIVLKKEILTTPNSFMFLVVKVSYQDETLNQTFIEYIVVQYDKKLNDGTFNGTGQNNRNEAIRYVMENNLFKS